MLKGHIHNFHEKKWLEFDLKLYEKIFLWILLKYPRSC